MSVLDVKVRLGGMIALPMEQQSLVYNGKALSGMYRGKGEEGEGVDSVVTTVTAVLQCSKISLYTVEIIIIGVYQLMCACG